MIRYVLILFAICLTVQARPENKKREASPHVPVRHSYSEYHNAVAIPIPQPVPVSVPRPVPVRVAVAVPVDSPRPVPVAVPHPVPHIIPRPVAVPVDRPVAVPVSHPVPVTVTQGVGIPVPQPYAVSVPAPVPVRVPQAVPVPVVAQAVPLGVVGAGLGLGGISSGIGLGGLASGLALGGISSGVALSGVTGIGLGGISGLGLGGISHAYGSIGHPIISSSSVYAPAYHGAYLGHYHHYGHGFHFLWRTSPSKLALLVLSLKFGSILSAIILILYSIFGLASCLAALSGLPPQWSPEDTDVIFSYAVIIVVSITHAITLFLSTLMMVGVLKEKANLIKPWVILTSLQVLVDLLVFVFWTTIGMIHHYGDTTDLVIYVLEFLGLMVRFYMLMIVSSYFRQLEDITIEEREKLRDLINNENWYTA